MEIEKEEAVKEFAEKLKAKARSVVVLMFAKEFMSKSTQ